MTEPVSRGGPKARGTGSASRAAEVTACLWIGSIGCQVPLGHHPSTLVDDGALTHTARLIERALDKTAVRSKLGGGVAPCVCLAPMC